MPPLKSKSVGLKIQHLVKGCGKKAACLEKPASGHCHVAVPVVLLAFHW